MLDENLNYGMDWDLFIRIGKRFRVDYISAYLGSIREHGEAKTSTGGLNRFRELVGLIRRHGIVRYPQAYFNYAWDVVGVQSPSSANGGKISLYQRAIRSFSPLLKRMLPFFLRHIEQGYYSDSWVAKNAMIVLPNPNPSQSKKKLLVTGEFHEPNTPVEVSISVNNRRLVRKTINQPGLVNLTVPLCEGLSNADSYHVEIRSSRTFVPHELGISADCRPLAFFLKSISVTDDREDDVD
jgi:hypothetical protein